MLDASDLLQAALSSRSGVGGSGLPAACSEACGGGVKHARRKAPQVEGKRS